MADLRTKRTVEIFDSEQGMDPALPAEDFFGIYEVNTENVFFSEYESFDLITESPESPRAERFIRGNIIAALVL